MLVEFIDTNRIQLNAEVQDWEEAVRTGGKLLVSSKKVSNDYVEAMVESVKENGPYIVISKHVAMPHARPEDGVLESAISITTLKTPIEFGHEQNDPVKYVFCLSTVDDSSHLEALASLVDLLGDDDFYQLLDDAKNPEEVMDYIKTR